MERRTDRTHPSPERMRIAAHNGANSYGGGEKWTVLLLRGLRERGHAVHLFCNHPDIAAKAEEVVDPAQRFVRRAGRGRGARLRHGAGRYTPKPRPVTALCAIQGDACARPAAAP